MTMLTVGAVVNIPVARDGASQTPELFRDEQRMSDTTLRVLEVGAAKDKWEITTVLMDDADAATLRAQILTTSLPVTCSGDLLGGSISCIPRLTGYAPVSVRGVLKRRVSFTLRKV